jgi:hypothetical protein
LSGAHFTRRRQPRVQDRRTFGDETAILDWGRRASSGTLPVPPRAPDVMSPSGVPRPWSSRTFVAGARPSVPSAPKVGAATWDHSCATKLTRHKWHQRFVSARAAKASPRDRSRRQTEGGQRGRTRGMLPKTNFPNSSPSSVRAVLILRWAELTIDLVRVKNGLRNSPGRPTLTRRPEKRRVLPLGKFTVVRDCYWVKV